ncbi:hypothetical protein GIB67_000901 [Kingdonia uniflora]|uniref:HIT-type domain-containing protein n=1 Tax=Kingdonia uniflora TaxID=39325 RepID=A0A7J7MG13_9MAGN|nr:hypothetical protein GIB67_000901 [Kingdonia uniflora]
MAEEVIVSEKPSTSFQALATTKTICRVCQKQFSQYTCPRCNSRYCSLQCYKTHSLRCTESFMRENVEEELRQIQPDDKMKQKMVEILKRFHSEEEETDLMDEDDDSSLSVETIQKILSGNQICLDDLNAEEMKTFRRAVASGELSKLIEPWEPWWLKSSATKISLSHEGTQLIKPLCQQSSPVGNHLNEIPPGPENPLLPISKLSSTQPSPFLAFHMVDIIYSYCFTLRLYNGDHQSDPLGVAMVMLSISLVLVKGEHLETVSKALAHPLEQTCSPAYNHAGGLKFGMGLLDDIISLLKLGGPALVCSLCDLRRLIEAGEREVMSEKLSKLKRAAMKGKFKFAERKLYYMMCWVHEQPNEAWSSLSAIVEVEKKSLAAMTHGGNKKPVNMDAEGQTRSKVLIEEVQ